MLSEQGRRIQAIKRLEWQVLAAPDEIPGLLLIRSAELAHAVDPEHFKKYRHLLLWKLLQLLMKLAGRVDRDRGALGHSTLPLSFILNPGILGIRRAGRGGRILRQVVQLRPRHLGTQSVIQLRVWQDGVGGLRAVGGPRGARFQTPRRPGRTSCGP